jgi:hypothetical protein
MNYRIIETGSTLPDVILYREFDSETNNCGEQGHVVVICAIGAIGTVDQQNEVEGQEYEWIEFQSASSAKAFIQSYTVANAKAWCTEKRNHLLIHSR